MKLPDKKVYTYLKVVGYVEMAASVGGLGYFIHAGIKTLREMSPYQYNIPLAVVLFIFFILLLAFLAPALGLLFIAAAQKFKEYDEQISYTIRKLNENGIKATKPHSDGKVEEIKFEEEKKDNNDEKEAKKAALYKELISGRLSRSDYNKKISELDHDNK